MRSKVQTAVSWLAWPILMIFCIVAVMTGFAVDNVFVTFNIAYFSLAFILYVLEQKMPHEPVWNERDGQTFANIAHTLSSKGTVQGLFLFGGIIGLTQLINSSGDFTYGIWPTEWPMVAQVVLGLVIAELGLYWAHRIGHEWYPLWRFHAVHHSVERLWIVNTGRFHFINSLISIVMGLAPLLLLGAPMEIIQWLSFITAFIGMLTHCNVRMQFWVLSWIFNTPELHRWHHSRDDWEGNKNFGENLMLWDHVFGTWFNPARRPPVNIGIKEKMPARFIDQLLWPFKGLRLRHPETGRFVIIRSNKAPAGQKPA